MKISALVKDRGFTVDGLLNPMGERPCFVFPVYSARHSNRSGLLQILDKTDTIVDFEPFSLSGNVHHLCEVFSTSRRIGDPGIFGFFFGRNDLIIGTRAEVQSVLRRRADEVRTQTFLFLEVQAFLNNARGVESALADATSLRQDR